MIAVWIVMLATNLLIPLMMIGIGRYFQKGALPSINYVFGYRTTMSMKNKDTWEFAHRHIGSLWYKVGFVLLFATVIAMLFLWNRSPDAIGYIGCIILCVQVIPMLIPVSITERALKYAFDENGNPKNE